LSDSDIAIEVDGVSKCYRIFDQPKDRVLQLLARNKRRYFREFWALRDLSFQIRRGETMGIIGRNGAGKSTLLQLISGTLTPTSGAVRIAGRVAALLELGAGFNPDFTGRENVILNATILGLTRAQIDERMDDILGFADIGDFVDQPVKTFSSGMFVRLAFSVVAHVDADILMVDEALAVGDAVFTQRCMRFLRRFQDNGTLLFVSHDTGAVVGLCRNAIWLERGKMRMNGNAKDVAEAYLAFCVTSRNSDMQIGARGLSTGDSDPALPATDPAERVEFFGFDPDTTGFGLRGATIGAVDLLDQQGEIIPAIEGGERVVLRVRCTANRAMTKPIIGFFIKDRLGQYLFGENSYVTYRGRDIPLEPGQTFEARFSFDLPFLPGGDYSVCVAVAEGTQEAHVQHHWIHDALVFKSLAGNGVRGLIGIPMNGIELRALPAGRETEPAVARRD